MKGIEIKKKTLKKLIVIVIILLFSLIVYGIATPQISTSRISPSIIYTNNTLIGYCNATHLSGDNLIYYYRWYRNDTLNISTSLGKYYNPSLTEKSRLSNSSSMDYTYSIKVVNDTVYVAGYYSKSLTILNISNKSNIKQISSYINATHLISFNYFDLDKNYVYATTDSTYDFVIINITNPLSMSITDLDTKSFVTLPSSINVNDGYAYVTDQNNDSLLIYNVSNPTNIKLLTNFSNTSSLNSVTDSYYKNNLVYAIAGFSHTLTILNVTNKTNIKQINSFYNVTSLTTMGEVVVNDNLAYISSGALNSIVVINVTDPKNMKQITTFQNTTSLTKSGDLYYQNNYLYKTTTTDGYILTMIDVNNTFDIKQIDSIYDSDLDKSNDIFTLGGYTFLSAPDNDSIIIYDNGLYYPQGTEYNIINLSLNNTLKGENWTLSCLAFDGITNSSWSNTTIDILNYPPTLTVTISPRPAEINDDLTFINTSNDIDDDSITMWGIKWYNNSKEIITLRNITTVNHTNTSSGSNWTVSIRAYDGQNWSRWFNSSTINIDDTTFPTLNALNLSESSIYTDQTYIAYANCSDTNSDLEPGYPIVMVKNPVGDFTNYTMALVSGKRYSKSLTAATAGTYNHSFFCADQSGNMKENMTISLLLTSLVRPSIQPSGGGGSAVFVAPGESFLEFNSFIEEFLVLFTPNKKEKTLLVKNTGNSSFIGTFKIQGEIKEFISAELCSIDKTDCIMENLELVIEPMATRFIILYGNFNKSIGEYKEGFLTFTEKNTKETYEFPVKITRPIGYRYYKDWGNNEKQGFFIALILAFIFVVAIFYIPMEGLG